MVLVYAEGVWVKSGGAVDLDVPLGQCRCGLGVLGLLVYPWGDIWGWFGGVQASVCLWGGYKGMAWGFDCPPHLVLVEGGTWRPPATLAAPPCPVGRMWAQFGGPICLYRTLGVGHGDNQGLPMTS